MSDYIKREDACERLWKQLRRLSDLIPMGEDAAGVAVRIIEDLPIADVVEVVRCKDCKRGGWRVSGLDNKTKGYRCAIHAVLGVDFGDNGYCSYGERKEK